MKCNKLFKNPYIRVIVLILISSLIGISIEYILHKDFQKSGIGTTIFALLILLWITKKNNGKKQ